MTTIILVKIATLNTGHYYPSTQSFELQVKQPKNLGHFYPFEFTVYIHYIILIVISLEIVVKEKQTTVTMQSDA